eukprot:84482-Amphidinium_carterae.1
MGFNLGLCVGVSANNLPPSLVPCSGPLVSLQLFGPSFGGCRKLKCIALQEIASKKARLDSASIGTCAGLFVKQGGNKPMKRLQEMMLEVAARAKTWHGRRGYRRSIL